MNTRAAGRDAYASLEHFDVVELLLMLARRESTGVFEVVGAADTPFELELAGGLAGSARLGVLQGEAALGALLSDPSGSFRLRSEAPSCEETRPVPALLMSVLRGLPAPVLPFEGPARVSGDVDLEPFELTAAERVLLASVLEAPSLEELQGEARDLAARLGRLGLLLQRRSRVARLIVRVQRERGAAFTIDERILESWERQLDREVRDVQLRLPEGRELLVRVEGLPGLGADVLVTPEALLVHRLKVGLHVLARPG